MNFIRNNFANALTLGNLFSGSIGVINLIEGDFKTTAICILVSLVLDFFDGFVARALKANSNLGIQLDSLADMVSFGLIPGVAMYKMLEPFGHQIAGFDVFFEVKYLGLLITIFSCLRLAIFNTDEDQTYYFKGLNTPTNTIFIFGIYYLLNINPKFSSFFYGQFEFGLIIITFLSSWLLVSPIKMISLKFKSKKAKDNLPILVLGIGIVVLLLVFGISGIPLSVIYYVLVSLGFQKQLGRP